ncbi:UDP-N-acetylmuramate dehydrogenase [Leptospira sp. 96542]|nr:UDP-N-acetylmuramate dehydrogenase [Leptospira sp. 96542]
MLVQNQIPLAPLTTIGLGGNTNHYIQIKTTQDLCAALSYAKENSLDYFVLGGGSNTIFRDQGFSGVVFHIQIPGIRCMEETNEFTIYKVGAGVVWDSFVEHTTKQGFVGIESLSGIPGFVGASPIQNIGAYGQEVKDSILEIETIDVSGQQVIVSNQNANFTYRNSEFKSGNLKNNIIIYVIFKVFKNKSVCLRYPEVQKHWLDILANHDWNQMDVDSSDLEKRIEVLAAYRAMILKLRSAKSMLYHPKDPNAKSVGSFFTNPILSKKEIDSFLERVESLQLAPPQLFLNENNQTKLSAAWLIEQSGFKKGMKFPGGVAISEKHCLALINENGTTETILQMAETIREQVLLKFGLKLEREPVVFP